MENEIERNKPGFWMSIVLIFVSFWTGVAVVLLIGFPADKPAPSSGTGFYCEEPTYHWIGTKKEYLKFRNRVRMGECEVIGMFGEENGKEDVKKHFQGNDNNGGGE